MYRRYFKRIFDIIIASLLLVLLFPMILLTAIFVFLFIGFPIIFSQWRPGLNEKPFRIYKFRTMLDLKDKSNSWLADDQRLTKFGKLLRKLSIDELPALINVLKNDMSLVGPRPLLMAYLPYYSQRQRLRHHIKPGLTGWAQVNGRNQLSWEKRFELDVWYVENCSFWLDCKIIGLTLFKIIKSEGISAENHVTMTRFDLEVTNRLKDDTL